MVNINYANIISSNPQGYGTSSSDIFKNICF